MKLDLKSHPKRKRLRGICGLELIDIIGDFTKGREAVWMVRLVDRGENWNLIEDVVVVASIK